MAAQTFTQHELESIRVRADALAHAEDDPSLRTALQLFGESAANLAVKLAAQEAAESGGVERQRTGPSRG